MMMVRGFLDLVATAWALAKLAAIGLVAAGLALVVVPAAFVAIWCLEALQFFKPVD